MTTENNLPTVRELLAALVGKAASFTGTAIVAVGDDEVRLSLRGGNVVGGSARQPLPTVIDLAVEYKRIKPEDRDIAKATGNPVATLMAGGALTPELVSSLELAALTIGFGRALAAGGPWRLSTEIAAAGVTDAPAAVSSTITDFVRRALATASSENALRAMLGFFSVTWLESGADTTLPLSEREKNVVAVCKSRLPCSVDSLLPDPAGGEKARVDILAGLAALESAGVFRRCAPKAEAVPAAPAPHSMTIPPNLVQGTAAQAAQAQAAQAQAAQGHPGPGSTNPPAASPTTMPPTTAQGASLPDRLAAAGGPAPSEDPARRRLPTLMMQVPSGAGEASGPRAAAPGSGGGSDWQPEPFDAFAARRAAQLKLDLSKQENVDALENEYLGRTVEAGVNNAAWAAVLPLAEKWHKRNPKNPAALVASARARFHIRPHERPALLEEITRASMEFRKSVDIQHAFADFAFEAGKQEAFLVALRRFAELVPKSDQRLRTMLARRRRLEMLLEPNPLMAVAAAVIVAAVVAGVSAQLDGIEPTHHPIDGKWMARHIAMLVAAIGLFVVSTKELTRVLGSALVPRNVPEMVLAAGVGAMVGFVRVVLYGVGPTPEGFFLPVALATVFVHIVCERMFVNAAVQELLAFDDKGLAGVLGAVVLQSALLLTYSHVWGLHTTLPLWIGNVALFVGVPCAILWNRSRSIWGPVCWQMGISVVEMVAKGI